MPILAASTSSSSVPFGLLAGGGDFPLLVAQAAASSGQALAVVCIKGITDKQIEQHAQATVWLDVGQLNTAITFLRGHGVKQASMAGRVPHSAVFSMKGFDWRAVKLAAKIGLSNLRADRLLSVVSDEFRKDGIEIVDSSLFLKSLMPEAGLITRGRPLTEAEMLQVEFGHPIAKAVAGQDIGQTIVVKDGVVVAVEALEGTDECIRRAGQVAGPGCVVIKVSKPQQDLRFDIPVVGEETVRSLSSAGASAMVLSSGRSLLLFRDRVERAAEAAGVGLAIVSEHADGSLQSDWRKALGNI